MNATLTPAATFTAIDRCDRCDAQARVRVILSGGAVLLFCGHHARQHHSALETVAESIQTDEETELF